MAMLDHASNWQIYALQTEEERGEGGFALPLDIGDSSNITFANPHMYRVVSSYQPLKSAASITNSSDTISQFALLQRGKVSFDSAIYDQTHDTEIRQREFSWLTISGAPPEVRASHPSAVLAEGGRWRKSRQQFFQYLLVMQGPTGNVHFVDGKNGRPFTAGQPGRANYRKFVIIRSIQSSFFSIRLVT